MCKHKLFLFIGLLFIACLATPVFAAEVLKGQVVDSNKEPLPGVNVLLKGVTLGTITNIDGNFTITVPEKKGSLMFSYIGFASKEVKIAGQSVFQVVLEEDSKGLDEVVIVGYGSVRKRDLTGAVSQLKPDETESSKFSSVDNLLQGKIAGLSVTSSAGQPGGAVSVQIRGANSLRGDNEPLYVIDNIPQSSPAEGQSNKSGDFQPAQNPLTSLNPQDIESIEILKDASATAIYGSRGANGVILVTTKKGKSGKTSLAVNFNFTVAEPYKYLPVLGLDDYGHYMNAKGNIRYYYQGDEVRLLKSALTADKYDANDPNTYSVLQEKNWQKEIYRLAFSENVGVTLNGGSEKTTYYLSANFKNIEGLVRNTGMVQGDFRLNLNSTLAKNLTLNTTLNGSVKQNNMMSGGDTKGGASGSIVRSALDYAPYLTPSDELINLQPENKSTVLSWLDDYSDITNDYIFRGSLDLNWKIAKWISYSMRAGGNIRFMDRSRWWGLQLFKGLNDNGYLNTSNLMNYNYTFENLLNLNYDWGRIASISGVVGVTYDQYSSTTQFMTGTEFSDFTLKTNGLHLSGKQQIDQPDQNDYQLLSFLARANLSFLDGRYLLTASFRADGSSKFLTNKWGYFPSVSVAWRLEQEEFMKGFSRLDQFKIRLGWGMTGNQGISPYQTIYDYKKELGYATIGGNTTTAMVIARLANKDIKWETTSSANVGVDLAFFKQRLSVSADAYYKKTSDLLILRDLPLSSGFSQMAVNQGGIDNMGLEVTLNADLIRTKSVVWDVSANIGVNKGWISSLELPAGEWGTEGSVSAYLGNSLGDQFGAANIFINGRDPGLFWGYKTDGIIRSEEDRTYIDASGNVKTYTYKVGDNKVGNIKYIDQNADGVIDSKDQTVLGTPNPLFSYGFSTGVSYFGFRLSAQFNGKYGNQILNTNVWYNEMPGKDSPNIYTYANENAYTAENNSSLYPAVTSARAKSKAVILDRYIQDGSYLRCSDVTLSYNFKTELIRKAGMQKLGLFVTAQNLFVITNYTGYDPEVNSFAYDGTRRGIDMNGFPNPRSFIVGLNVTF